MRRIFRICDFENAIVCRKICDLHFLQKYAIAYSHITSIPNYSKMRAVNNMLQYTNNSGFNLHIGNRSIIIGLEILVKSSHGFKLLCHAVNLFTERLQSAVHIVQKCQHKLVVYFRVTSNFTIFYIIFQLSSGYHYVLFKCPNKYNRKTKWLQVDNTTLS